MLVQVYPTVLLGHSHVCRIAKFLHFQDRVHKATWRELSNESHVFFYPTQKRCFVFRCLWRGMGISFIMPMSDVLCGLLLGVRCGSSHFSISLLISLVVAPRKTWNLNRKGLTVVCDWFEPAIPSIIPVCSTHLFVNFSDVSLIAPFHTHNTGSETTCSWALQIRQLTVSGYRAYAGTVLQKNLECRETCDSSNKPTCVQPNLLHDTRKRDEYGSHCSILSKESPLLLILCRAPSTRYCCHRSAKWKTFPRSARLPVDHLISHLTSLMNRLVQIDSF